MSHEQLSQYVNWAPETLEVTGDGRVALFRSRKSNQASFLVTSTELGVTQLLLGVPDPSPSGCGIPQKYPHPSGISFLYLREERKPNRSHSNS